MAEKEPKDLEARFKELSDRNAQLMALLEAKLEADVPSSGIDGKQLEAILTRVTEAAAGPSQLLASKLKPENADHLQRGPFEHPDGGISHPKPTLAREVIFGGRLRADELTYAEVEALNALSASLTRSQRRLARDGKWSATVSDDDQRLTIRVPVKTIDDRQDLPPFLGIVLELTSGAKALEPADIMNELVLLRSQMAQLQGARA